MNTAGLEASSQALTIRPINPPPIEIRSLEFDSQSVSAELRWGPYLATNFASYRIVRRQPGLASQVVAEIADRNDTVWADSGLRGNTVYSYSVEALTTGGQSLVSTEQSGSIHRLLRSWSLGIPGLPGVGFLGGVARLYVEDPDFSPGRVTALIARRQSTSLSFFSPVGELLAKQELARDEGISVRHRSTTTALTAEGRRVLSFERLVSGSIGVSMGSYDRDGTLEDFETTPLRQWYSGDLQVDQPWSGMVSVGGGIAKSIGERRYDLSLEGEELSFGFTAPISEMRVWDDPEDGGQMMGVSLVDRHQILASVVSRSSSGALNWPVPGAIGGAIVGIGLGTEDGELRFPLSFDVGPDGRFYVLDAGNSRIQVFAANGEYLTQWGTRGSEEGEFDFGVIGNTEIFLSLAGSIAVDDEGLIYVADVRNNRIQQFAP